MAEIDAIDTFFESGGETLPPDVQPARDIAPEPEPERQEPTPEPKPAVQQETPPKHEPERQEVVPHAALAEARARAQAAEAREREILALLKQVKGEPERKPDDNAQPDPNDPIATIEWLRKQVETTQNTLAQQRQMTEQQQRVAELGNRVSMAEDVFRKAKPDYDDAADFVRERLLAFHELQGTPPEVARQYLVQNQIQMLGNAVAAGKDPAAVVYDMAQRFGYQPKGATPPPAASKEAEAKIAQIAAGQEAAKGRGGQGEDDTMTMEKLASLDGAAFDKAWDKMFPKRHSVF